MRSPSTCGFNPRSLSRMAFSTIFHGRLVPRLDGDHASLGDVDRGQLPYRGRHPVIVDPEAIEHAGVRAARSDLTEIAFQRFVGFTNGGFEITQNFVEHVGIFLEAPRAEALCEP